MLIGLTPDSTDMNAPALNAYGNPDQARAFMGKTYTYINPTTDIPKMLAAMQAAATPFLSLGITPHLSQRPDPAATISGAMNAHLRAAADYCASIGAPYTPWHEPQNKIPGFSNPAFTGPSQYVQTYQQVYMVMKEQEGDNIQVGPIDLAYQWQPGMPGTANPEEWRIPASMVDFYGLDIYTMPIDITKPWGARMIAYPGFLRWCDYTNVGTKKIRIAERGITPIDGGIHQQTLALDVADLNSMGGDGLNYWGVADVNQQQPWRLLDPSILKSIRTSFAVETYSADAVQQANTLGRRKALNDVQSYVSLQLGRLN